MDERMSPQADEMLKRAELFAQFLGSEMITVVHLLAGYMVVERGHYWPHGRMMTSRVFESIFDSTIYRAQPSPKQLQRDPEVVAIIQSATEAVAARGQGQKVAARDLMIAMLESGHNHATEIIGHLTRRTHQELLKGLREQLV